jgi:hypothetical protein
MMRTITTFIIAAMICAGAVRGSCASLTNDPAAERLFEAIQGRASS